MVQDNKCIPIIWRNNHKIWLRVQTISNIKQHIEQNSIEFIDCMIQLEFSEGLDMTRKIQCSFHVLYEN